MTILVTGGAGYIGSHTCLELLNAGHEVVVVDNLSNSVEEGLHRVEGLTGKSIVFYKLDLHDREALAQVFRSHQIEAVIHFAAFKAVGEAVANPLKYYQNNIAGTITLLEVMAAHNVKNFVFSSSATVYGDPASSPITEDFPIQPTNPYGSSKSMIEIVLQDVHTSDPDWNIIILRYFNPVGAHPSGMIGEDPNGIPNNLMPYITQVAVGKLEKLSIFGNEYDTPDGTGVRDYIHVVDLSLGHVKALEKISSKPGVETYNLGTGTGYSVLDVVDAFIEVSGIDIPYEFGPPRPGDVPACYADVTKANQELGWQAQYGLADMCADAWRWQSNNPKGYR